MPSAAEPPPGVWARTVAKVVRDHITEVGMTQAALAERVGLHPSTLGRVFAGDRSFTLDEAARVAECLGLTPTHLVQRAHVVLTGTPPPPPD